MATVTATETFDEETLEPETYEDLEPLIAWLNENFQSIISAFRGEIGVTNLNSDTVETKAVVGQRNKVDLKTKKEIGFVQAVRVVSSPDELVLLNGFNWWPTAIGFDFACDYSGDKKDRNIILEVVYNG